VTPAGVSYIVDRYNHNIRAITALGVVTTLAGTSASGSTNAVGTAASFSYPRGVIHFNSTNLYVADTSNYKIRQITISTGATTTFAGSGSYSRIDGSSTLCAFKSPYGVTVSTAGILYVADRYSQAIRKTYTNGWTTTLAGSLLGTSGSTDASGSSARFYNPYDVSVNTDGYVFVADASNSKLRIVSPGGVVTTASTVTLTNPHGVDVTSAGSVYIGCFNSEKVMAYTDGTMAPTTATPTATPTTPVPSSASSAAAVIATALAVILAVLA
jgi:hypothetical protein